MAIQDKITERLSKDDIQKEYDILKQMLASDIEHYNDAELKLKIAIAYALDCGLKLGRTNTVHGTIISYKESFLKSKVSNLILRYATWVDRKKKTKANNIGFGISLNYAYLQGNRKDQEQLMLLKLGHGTYSHGCYDSKGHIHADFNIWASQQGHEMTKNNYGELRVNHATLVLYANLGIFSMTGVQTTGEISPQPRTKNSACTI